MRTAGWHLTAIVFATFVEFGCRDFGLAGPDSQVVGYRIEGSILDGLDQPIDSLDIHLYYDLAYVSNTPEPVRAYSVVVPEESVTVNVYDIENQIVRNLYTGSSSGSSFYVPWNKRGNNGALVESGVYVVRYQVGGGVRHSYDVVADGHVTARTDRDGLFTIENANLPIDYYPAPLYDNSDNFLGNFHILGFVRLEFTISNTLYYHYVSLNKDKVTHVALRLD